MKPPHSTQRLLLACAVIAISGSMTLCSCLSPRTKEIIAAAAPLVVPLAQAAEDSGHLPPGSSVIISRGSAVITSAETQEVKLMKLKDLGVETAVHEGLLKEGDKLLVDQAGVALVKVITASQAEPERPLPVPKGESIADSLAPNPLLPAP